MPAALESMVARDVCFGLDIGTRCDDLFVRGQKARELVDAIGDGSVREKAAGMLYFSAGIWPAEEAIHFYQENERVPQQVAALVVNPDTVLFLVMDDYLSTSVEVLTDGLHPGDEATLCGELKEMEDLNGSKFWVLDLSEPMIGNVVGEWNMYCMAVTEMESSSDYMLSTTLYIPETEGQNINIVFREDGTATYTVTGTDATSQEGTWSIDDEGMLCCSLLQGGSCWYINWLTSSTLIISRPGSGDDENKFYQMQFEKM